MLGLTMLPSSLVLLISTLVQHIEAAPIKQSLPPNTVLEEVEDKSWGPGSGAGSWQSAWPYIPAQPWATNWPSPAPLPSAYTGWNTPPPPVQPTFTQWFTSVASETFTSDTTIYSTYTTPTTTVIISTPAVAPESPTTISTPFVVSPTSPFTEPIPSPSTLPDTSVFTTLSTSPSTLPDTSVFTTLPTSTPFESSPAQTFTTRRRTRPHRPFSQSTPAFPTSIPFTTVPTTTFFPQSSTSEQETSSTTTSIPLISTSVIVSVLPTTPIPTTVPTTIPITEVSSSIVIIPVPTISDTTISSSVVVPTVAPTPTGSPAPGSQLSVTINNDLGDNANAYLTGVDSSGALVMLTTDGTFYTPTANSGSPEQITANVALPLNPGSNQFTLPDYISSARIWFSIGTLQFSAVATPYGVGLVEPTVTNVNDASETLQWAFVELTWIVNYGLFANLSFVDFVGLAVGMSLTTTDGGSQSAPGMPASGAEQVCASLKGQAASDGQPWDQLCEYDSNGALVRVLSPGSYLSINSGAFAGYFDDYVNQVWSKYASEPLYIQSQNSLGQISCQVSGGTLNCDGDNRGYAPPTSQDIFSCSTGPFAIEQSDNDVHLAVVPRLCAAFNRATLLIDGGNVQPQVPPSQYYPVSPNNMYSKFVHATEIQGEGYAFPYDDVAPSVQDDVAGIVASPNPAVLTVNLGG